MIEIKDLSRSFGNIKAVDNISFTVMPGEIVGFLGPNGAGKTTTMRMMVGFLQPVSGSIKINGKDINEDPIETAKSIGYLPETNPLYDEMIVFDYLEYISKIRSMSTEQFKKRLAFVIEKCGLKTVMAQTIGTLSKGYRQRTGLAQAIIHDPTILILDEPTSGLDPNQILEIRDLIRELGQEKTVILSSHIMQEVQALCDRVIIINQGKIIADDTKQNLSQNLEDRTQLVVEIDGLNTVPGDWNEHLKGITLVQSNVSDKVTSLIFEGPSKLDIKREVAKYLNQSGLLILGMYIRQYSLEEVFHNLTMHSETSSKPSLIESTEESEPKETLLSDSQDEEPNE